MSIEALYPLKLRPMAKEKIWGGRNLARLLDKYLPRESNVGESWEIADDSMVDNGPLAGRRLAGLTKTFGPSLLGSMAVSRYGSVLPLMIKFIDAQDRLSVQVHPDDEYAKRVERVPFGKTEMWYVLEAAPGAAVIHGIKTDRLTPAELAQLADDGGIVDHLHSVEVSAGDVIFIPAGTVHAMGQGLVVCEVQQNCDVTYRLYDWGRLTSEGCPRDLHVEKAVAVSRRGPHVHKIPSLSLRQSHGRRTILSACRYFMVELQELLTPVSSRTDGRSFLALSTISGGGELSWPGGRVNLGVGESAILPAALGDYELQPTGEWRILVARVPDLVVDVVQPLLAAGVEASAILQLGGAPDSNDLAHLLR